MPVSEMCRRQHKDILDVAAKLNGLLTESALKADPMAVRMCLSELAGKVKLHLAWEDKSVYPMLVAQAETSQLARRFQDSMGGLVNVFTAFVTKYQVNAAITGAPADFIRESRGVLGALSERIRKEETELYVGVD